MVVRKEIRIFKFKWHFKYCFVLHFFKNHTAVLSKNILNCKIIAYCKNKP